MQGQEPYCYRCRQTYGCICKGAQFTEASVMLRELEAERDMLRARVAILESPVEASSVQQASSVEQLEELERWRNEILSSIHMHTFREVQGELVCECGAKMV